MDLMFNDAGPQRPGKHYTIDPLRRIKVKNIKRLIEAERYFVLHAPRQSGKTSCLLAVRDLLNKEGIYRALYVNIEAAKALPETDVQASLTLAIANAIRESFPAADWRQLLSLARNDDSKNAFPQIIREFCLLDPTQPVVLFIDEADSLSGQATVTYLSQLRAGYSSRPVHFPQSIILCGLKDIRDFRMTDDDGKPLTAGSAFNILSDSLRLGNFSRDEVIELYAQHTAVSGQIFDPEAVNLAFDLTDGQPWMINKLGDIACFQTEPGRNRTATITPEIINAAREEMIRRRVIHLDNLAFRLKEDRVRRILEQMMTGGEDFDALADSEDLRYCLDLGLIRLKDGKQPVIANPIYQEIIPRELTFLQQMELHQETAWYRESNGHINLPKLLRAFLTFYQAHGESDRFFPQYSEAGAQLLLQAWLQRIINGGGQIEREYALGTKRVDILVRWPYPQPVQEMVIEMKVIRNRETPASVLNEGLTQIDVYMERVKATEGHLMIFDQRPGIAWAHKFSEQTMVTPQGREITVWGG
jgi:hypothetical protein